jgi:hypothetical protein
MSSDPSPEERRALEEERALEERLSREFGPDVPHGRRRLIGLAAIVGFIGLVIWVVLAGPR